MTTDLCLSVRKLRRLPSVPNIAVVKLRGPERKYFRLENRAGETSTRPHFCWMVAEIFFRIRLDKCLDQKKTRYGPVLTFAKQNKMIPFGFEVKLVGCPSCCD